MSHSFDQVILEKIKKILTETQLSPEMVDRINSSLTVESKNGERFKWAHLTLMNCECVGGKYDAALAGAIAMEFAALAADIFDDIQDQDHNDLPWRQISLSEAQNLAICLSMLSYQAISTLPGEKVGLYSEISRILSHMWVTASDGQLQEVLFDAYEHITFDQYFELVQRKSGSLTACACKIGAILGGASESVVIQLGQFGTNLGIMSQIRNDLSDFTDFKRKNDFVIHRKTLPYVYLSNILEGHTAEQFKELTEINDGLTLKNQEQDDLKQWVMDEGVIQYGEVMYDLFRKKSLEIIQASPVSEKSKEKMMKLVEDRV